MKTKTIRNLFISFFKENGYAEYPESPLIIDNDKSLLFTNSGMVQFKNFFLGIEKPLNSKIITIQTCIRVGGKHNDLDTIGKTCNHNTSFSMLGNFGFENISKLDSINLSWKFLVDIIKLESKNLFVTVHKNDKESYDVWQKVIGLNKTNIIEGNDESNLWLMADEGPCGYCTEIFYNTGNEDKNLLEIWNLVFINFNRINNKFNKLTSMFLDTGMGLERIASIKQNVFDNFKTDIYFPLVNTVEKEFKTSIYKQSDINLITDHIKTSILLINSGILPSNDGRGYILKKLIRRIIVKKNAIKKTANINNFIDEFIKILEDEHNYKLDNKILIKRVFIQEEKKFSINLNKGIRFFTKIFNIKKDINYKDFFMMYDTYGLPFDLINDIAIKNNLKFDFLDIKKEINNRKNLDKDNKINISFIHNIQKTLFLGYDTYFCDTTILRIIKNNYISKFIKFEEDGIIITKETSFYAEKGGQVGDTGYIKFKNNLFLVNNTKEINGIFLHYGKMVQGQLNEYDQVNTEIDIENRILIAKNHSATHLLNSALKKVLGDHVKQAGSFINKNYLRFDFLHFSPLEKNELDNIEFIVNNYIIKNLPVKITYLDKNKYNEKLRIVRIGNNESEEECAGTHVNNSNEIGIFKITKEFGIGNNIRRIEAITSYRVIEIFKKNDFILDNISKILKTEKEYILNNLDIIIKKNKKLEIEIEKIKKNFIKNEINNLILKQKKQKIKYIMTQYNSSFVYNIRNIINEFNNLIILNIYKNDNFYINIFITKNLEITLDALCILDKLKVEFKCKGGGNNKMIQGIIQNNFDINIISEYILTYIKNTIKREEKKC
jgi:alanyl-tRNA synthetase